jgi:sugar phosphate isomerase/epimerase
MNVQKTFLMFVILLGTVTLMPVTSFAEEPAKKTYPFFALMNDSGQPQSFDHKSKLLHELGFDGVAHFQLEWLPERVASAKKHSIKVAQIYFHVNLSADPPFDQNLEKVLPCVKGQGTQLAVTFDGAKPSDTSHEKRAVEILQQIIDIADQSDVKVVLYPHYGSWLETVADNVRIAKKFPDQKVGVMFNLAHWATVEQTDLESVLTLAKPWLTTVTINGSDTPKEMQTKKIIYGIKPLDTGTFDVAVLLKLLKKIDYDGKVGLQCWFLKGDDHLKRSMKEWRTLNGL